MGPRPAPSVSSHSTTTPVVGQQEFGCHSITIRDMFGFFFTLYLRNVFHFSRLHWCIVLSCFRRWHKFFYTGSISCHDTPQRHAQQMYSCASSSPEPQFYLVCSSAGLRHPHPLPSPCSIACIARIIYQGTRYHVLELQCRLANKPLKI